MGDGVIGSNVSPVFSFTSCLCFKLQSALATIDQDSFGIPQCCGWIGCTLVKCLLGSNSAVAALLLRWLHCNTGACTPTLYTAPLYRYMRGIAALPICSTVWAVVMDGHSLGPVLQGTDSAAPNWWKYSHVHYGEHERGVFQSCAVANHVSVSCVFADVTICSTAIFKSMSSLLVVCGLVSYQLTHLPFKLVQRQCG